MTRDHENDPACEPFGDLRPFPRVELDARRPYGNGLTVPKANLGIQYLLLCLVGRHPWHPWETYYQMLATDPQATGTRFRSSRTAPEARPQRSETGPGFRTHHTRSCAACGKVEDTGRAS